MKPATMMMIGARCGAVLWVAVALCGCDVADLPPGWSRAERIADFKQAKCHGSAYDETQKPVVEAIGATDGIAVEYQHAHFRCEQDVEGFLRRGDGTLDLLVQPVDMDPSSVAGCDCLYEIKAQLPVEPGTYAVTVYRRWDNNNHPNDPIEVGLDEALVPAANE